MEQAREEVCISLISHLPYRLLEGFLRELSEPIPKSKPTDYTSIWRRGNKLKLSLPDTISARYEPVVIALDSTGIKVETMGIGREKDEKVIEDGSKSIWQWI